MPEPIEHWPESAPGRFYVDRSCIDCGLCPNLAPNNFAQSEDATHSYVHRQPQTDDELALAAEALQTCPTNSIKDDGLEGHLVSPAREEHGQQRR